MRLHEYKQVDPSGLKFADYNPRSITPTQYEALRYSMQSFGMVQPAVVNRRNNVVVGGHQRLRVAMELGINPVPVFYVDLDDRSERALNVAMNRVGGEFDDRLLTKLLADLGSEGWDLSNLGFEDDELDRLLSVTAIEPEPGQFEPEMLPDSYDLIIHCSSEAEQVEVMELLDARGIACRPLIS